jgi:SAM-dependent methyltransferase
MYCLFCPERLRAKSLLEWKEICGRCKQFSQLDLEILYWMQRTSTIGLGIAPVIVRRSRFAAQMRYEAVMTAISETPNRVLDIGCSLGLGSDYFPHNTQYVGLDQDVDALEFATHRFGSHGKRFINGSADQIPWPDRYFDLVVMMDVVEHMQTQKMLRVLEEVNRVMAYGGTLCLSTPDGKLGFAKRLLGRKHARSHIVEYPTIAFIGHLQSVGFLNIVATGIFFPDLPASKVGGMFAHLLAEHPWAFSMFASTFRWLGYGNYLYVCIKR